MIIGQLNSRGSVKSSDFSPAIKGVAIGQMVATACIESYYVFLVALSMFYMFKSFSAELPWSKCWLSWTEPCLDSSSMTVQSGNRTVNASSSSELYFM